MHFSEAIDQAMDGGAGVLVIEAIEQLQGVAAGGCKALDHLIGERLASGQGQAIYVVDRWTWIRHVVHFCLP